MHNLAGTEPVVTAPNGDSRQLIVADLRSLIAQIETSMRQIEIMMSQANKAEEAGSADVFVLDDVTPRYATATAALGACKAGLDLALRGLSESGKSAETATAAVRRPPLIA